MHVFALSVICDELVLFKDTYIYTYLVVAYMMLLTVLQVCRLFLLVPTLLLQLCYLFPSVSLFSNFMFLFSCSLKWGLCPSNFVLPFASSFEILLSTVF
jgi:hypothetical protein